MSMGWLFALRLDRLFHFLPVEDVQAHPQERVLFYAGYPTRASRMPSPARSHNATIPSPGYDPRILNTPLLWS